MKAHISVSQSTNPYLNLAWEDHIFRNLVDGQIELLIYVNRPSVILGHFQNPYLEVQLQKLWDTDIDLVRRQSGGGTVYHDLGNINYSFCYKEGALDRCQILKFWPKFFKEFGVELRCTDRFDFFVEDEGVSKKVSGTAFKNSRKNRLHHGTFLIDSELDVLSDLLFFQQIAIDCKGAKSKRSPVLNLSRLNPNINQQVLIEYLEILGPIQNYSEQELLQIAGIEEKVQFYQSWEWAWGRTPPFNLENGLTVKRGIIQNFEEHSLKSDRIGPANQLFNQLVFS